MISVTKYAFFISYERGVFPMANVNLKAIPYCLSDEDIAWVENTIASMTDEEKVEA